MVAWLIALAHAAPPEPAPAPEVVVEVVGQLVEGVVRVTYPGRDGDQVHVDGWKAGVLPLETTLAEGPHIFRVDGPLGKREVPAYVTIVPNAITPIDLSAPPTGPVEAAPPAAAPAPATPSP